MLPPIRYPLPTLIALIVLGLAAYFGADLLRALKSEVGKRVEQVVHDQVPTEPDPKLTQAPIPRRGLVLRDDVAATESPDGPVSLRIGLRRLVDVLSVWPLRGTPTHYRVQVGNATGWVKADELLIWDTRLVVRVPQEGLPAAGGTVLGGGPPLPIVAIDGKAGTVTLAEWDQQAPWKEVRRLVEIKLADLPGTAIEAFQVRREVLEAAGRKSGEGSRLRAALGRLVIGAGDPIAPEAAAQLAPVLDRVGPADPGGVLKLTRLNENWRPDASWNTQDFRGVPLQWMR
jgi:hypothetical protein